MFSAYNDTLLAVPNFPTKVENVSFFLKFAISSKIFLDFMG